jgi:hypothetical protein
VILTAVRHTFAVAGGRAEIGIAFVVAGSVSTAALLAWNFVWVNTALYRITRDEMQAG